MDSYILKLIEENKKLKEIKNNFVSKDKIKALIENFKIIRDTIVKDEKELKRPMMTYDLKRNDYCVKMLESLLNEEE